jgi:exodeoxyribonuclease VII large subunit
MEERLFDPTPTLTVSELNQRIGTVIARAFPEEVWIQGEISGLRPERRPGTHLFFDLVEPGPDGGPGAKVRVTLWSDNRRGINALLRRAGGIRMEDGLDVRIRGSVDFFRRGGTVQLRMTSIDPEHTLGRLAASKDRTLQALRAEGLDAANGTLAVPPFPLQVALITSAESAAHHDVMAEFRASGLGWRIRVIDARVQGRQAEGLLCAALDLAAEDDPDVILITRGGGSRSDLAAFDSEEVARAIAGCAAPVITGIGHEVDRSVADEVAHSAHKTPTAAAAHLVGLVRDRLDQTAATWSRIGERSTVLLDRAATDIDRKAGAVPVLASGAVTRAGQELERSGRRLQASTRSALTVASGRHDQTQARLARSGPRAARRGEQHLAALESRLASLDPARLLARGWSVTRGADGAVIRSVEQAPPTSLLTTTLADGTIESTVTATDTTGA